MYKKRTADWTIMGIAVFLLSLTGTSSPGQDVPEGLLKYKGVEAREKLIQKNSKFGAIDIQIVMDKPNYALGDLVRVRVQASEDCFIRIYELNFDTQEVRCVYPNSFQIEGKIDREEIVSIPAGDSKWEWFAAEPLGTYAWIAVASALPFTEDITIIQAIKEGRQWVQVEETKVESLIFKGVQSRLKVSEYGVARKDFQIVR